MTEVERVHVNDGVCWLQRERMAEGMSVVDVIMDGAGVTSFGVSVVLVGVCICEGGVGTGCVGMDVGMTPLA